MFIQFIMTFCLGRVTSSANNQSVSKWMQYKNDCKYLLNDTKLYMLFTTASFATCLLFFPVYNDIKLYIYVSSVSLGLRQSH